MKFTKERNYIWKLFFINFNLPVTKNNKDEIIAQIRCLLGWAFLYVNNWSGLVDGASKSSDNKCIVIHYF